LSWYDQKPELRIQLADFGGRASSVVHIYENVQPSGDPSEVSDAHMLSEVSERLEEPDEHEQEIEASYQRGYQDGHIVGLNDLEAEVQKMSSCVDEVVSQIDRMRVNTAMLSMEIGRIVAEQILGEELALDPARYTNLISRAVDDFVGAGEIEITVSEGMSQDLVLAALDEDAMVKIIVDPEMGPGSFRLETESGRLDADIGARVRVLVDQLEELVHRRAVDELDATDFSES
jgi:flagellar biosynthesis/type III secretory pathway protein FliH